MDRKINYLGIALGLIVVVAVIWNWPGSEPKPEEENDSGKVITADGIAFDYPEDFGLATTSEQILRKSYIPACDEGFDYCLYYYRDDYLGTNFESAGLRIQKREDLSAEDCLVKPPEGYSEIWPSINNREDYQTSHFGPLGDAAAGHYANGELYRLAFNGKCYEFETRIGQSQFANYEPGTIKEFSEADLAVVKNKLNEVLKRVRFEDGGEIDFPESGSLGIISWEEAGRLIESCEVEEIFQKHSLEVQLGLKSGERKITLEPQIDEIFRLVKRANDDCGQPVMSTE